MGGFGGNGGGGGGFGFAGEASDDEKAVEMSTMGGEGEGAAEGLDAAEATGKKADPRQAAKLALAAVLMLGAGICCLCICLLCLLMVAAVLGGATATTLYVLGKTVWFNTNDSGVFFPFQHQYLVEMNPIMFPSRNSSVQMFYHTTGYTINSIPAIRLNLPITQAEVVATPYAVFEARTYDNAITHPFARNDLEVDQLIWLQGTLYSDVGANTAALTFHHQAPDELLIEENLVQTNEQYASQTACYLRTIFQHDYRTMPSAMSYAEKYCTIYGLAGPVTLASISDVETYFTNLGEFEQYPLHSETTLQTSDTPTFRWLQVLKGNGIGDTDFTLTLEMDYTSQQAAVLGDSTPTAVRLIVSTLSGDNGYQYWNTENDHLWNYFDLLERLSSTDYTIFNQA